MAIGETPLHKPIKRGKKLLRSMLVKGVASYLKRKRHWIKEVQDLPVPRNK